MFACLCLLALLLAPLLSVGAHIVGSLSLPIAVCRVPCLLLLFSMIVVIRILLFMVAVSIILSVVVGVILAVVSIFTEVVCRQHNHSSS